MADREKLIELIVEAMPPCYSDVFACRIADHLIANGVTVRERGRWLNWKGEPFTKGDFGWDWTCSVCKNTLEYEEPVTAEEFPSNFCPNCGADMRGEEDGK